jgi:hypothetical protein
MGRGRKRRYTVLLSEPVGRALKVEARARGVPMSRVVEEALSGVLSMRTGPGHGDEARVNGAGRGRWRVSLSQPVWHQLAGEARRRGVSMGRVIEECLSLSPSGGWAEVPRTVDERADGVAGALELDLRGADF